VLFDLDDTLFDHRHCARAALAGVRGLHTCFAMRSPAELERAHARILEDMHLEVLAGRLPLDAARVERFTRLYRCAGIEADLELATRTAAAYRDGYVEARQEVPGAAALLAAVRRHAPVVIVSNNLLAEQQDKLRQCGLEQYVDLLVVSSEAGVSKPDPRIFEIALARAGVGPAEAVMVGDSWENDIQGARAAGVRAVWFNRNDAAVADPAVPAITSLEPAESVLAVILGDLTITREPASALRR
jgi:putative hydrolase of the HAD superfamily